MALPRLNIQTGLIACAVLFGGYKVFDKPADYEIENAKRLAPPSREKRAIENKAYLEKTREYSEARAKGPAVPAPARPTAAAPPPLHMQVAAAPPPIVVQPLKFATPEPTTAPTTVAVQPEAADDAIVPDRGLATPPAEGTEPPKETRALSLRERLEQRSFTAKKAAAPTGD